MNGVIYARVSSAASGRGLVDDQIALCRERCEREGWVVVDVFADQTIGGNAGLDVTARLGIDAMLVRIEAGSIAQVVTEATDRIGCRQEDAHVVCERIRLGGARLVRLLDDDASDVPAIIREVLDTRAKRDMIAMVTPGTRDADRKVSQRHLAV